MAEAGSKPEPSGPSPRKWLVAAWPGMGNVAIIAAGYLINKLGLKPVAELGTPGLFDVKDVEVKGGVIETPRVPRNLVFRMPQPGPKLDLTVFLGEAQPDHGAMALSHGLLEHCAEYGIERVITFASMASQMHPTDEPRVHGASTSAELVEELRRAEVRIMDDGEIGGLNGVVLGAAAQRGLAGVCLLGEIPYYGAGVGNPKAARSVLDAFAVLAKIELDLEELNKHAESVEPILLDILEKLEEEEGDEDEEGAPGTEDKPAASEQQRAKIERLFEEARADRTKAVTLKQELDRMGLFRDYEDRFLDLFRRAE